MLHVRDSLVEQRGNVLVVQSVENVASMPLPDHESHLPQDPQLV